MADPNDGTILQSLMAKGPGALSNNVTFLAIPSPTQAQAIAQVQALTRQVDAMIRILLSILDTGNGT